MTGGLRLWAGLVGGEQVVGYLMLEGWVLVWMKMLYHGW